MKRNFTEFLRITKKLNSQRIIPLLMGSVGLEYLTQLDWQSRDIDIHVAGDPRGWRAPDEKRIHHWELILSAMEELGYTLTDLHEHAFSSGKFAVEFGVIDTLPEFAGVDPSELHVIDKEGALFYLPDAAQYLKIYTGSSNDNYRAENNNHKDLEKINYLKRLIQAGRK